MPNRNRKMTAHRMAVAENTSPLSSPDRAAALLSIAATARRLERRRPSGSQPPLVIGRR